MDIASVCKSCKRCCIGSEIRLIDEDIERWKREERLDILLCISPLLGSSRQLVKKKGSDECIFLGDDGLCRIHETKPFICKKFPTELEHAKAFDCKLIGLVPLKERKKESSRR